MEPSYLKNVVCSKMLVFTGIFSLFLLTLAGCATSYYTPDKVQREPAYVEKQQKVSRETTYVTKLRLNNGSIYTGPTEWNEPYGLRPTGRGYAEQMRVSNGGIFTGYVYTNDGQPKMDGQGKVVFVDGLIIEGEFKDNELNDRCTITQNLKNVIFKGECRKNKPYNGVQKEKDDAKGTWRTTLVKDGKIVRTEGMLIHTDGTKYTGTWEDAPDRNGGTISWPDGRFFKGRWRTDELRPFIPEGKGEMSWPDGRKYVGEFKDGKMNGYGKMIYADGRSEDGLWRDDRFVESAQPNKSVPNNAKTAKESGLNWAVVIGISKYQYAGQNGLTNLIFADDDAKSFSNTLCNLGWNESHIKLLTNEEATQRNVMIALKSWLTKAGPNDQIILFWAGHGFPDPDDPEKVYLATYDTEIGIPATGYRMDEVRRALEEIGSKNVLLFADTCHAGKLITRGEDRRGISIVPNIKQKNTPRGWVFMVGADTDRQAIENTSWSSGAFTHSLVNGLNGAADGFQSIGPEDGVVTMGELRAYMNTAMPEETQKVLGVAKRPVITTSTGDPDIWNLTLQLSQ